MIERAGWVGFTIGFIIGAMVVVALARHEHRPARVTERQVAKVICANPAKWYVEASACHEF